ncbi:MAG: tetratricopeptide repeat protein [Candidatus Hydrogenedentes bacterium]|nr:tetratricopeptide repeat protein [Candidatus Hydrogenedentota bacterium]
MAENDAHSEAHEIEAHSLPAQGGEPPPDGFTLPPEILAALRAAESGEASDLLDEHYLAVTDFLDDNSPLNPASFDTPLLAASEEPAAPPAGLSSALISDMDALPPAPLTDAPEPTAGDERVSGPMPGPGSDSIEAEEIYTPIGEEGGLLSQKELDAFLFVATSEIEESPVQSAFKEIREKLAATSGQAGNATPDAAGEIDFPILQDELDSLIAEHATPSRALTTESSAGEDPPLTQEDLDALLTAETAPPEPLPATAIPEDEAPLSQDDLDALIAAEAAPPEPLPATATPEDEAPLSQDDLDALIAAETAPPEPLPATAPPEDEAPLSQDDLDALIAAETAPPEPLPATATPEDEAPLSQDGLDALIAAQAGPPAESIASKSNFDQNELDALIAGFADPPPAPPSTPAPVGSSPAESPMGFSQADLDALIAQQSPIDSLVASDGTSTQDLLDQLISASPAEAPAEILTKPLSQQDIDALLSGAADQLLAGKADDAVLTPDLSDAPMSLSADSINALVADLDNETLNAIHANDRDTEEAVGAISQDMIDSLIADASGDDAPIFPSAETSGKVVNENFAAAATSAQAEGLLLTQADLDALIEQSKNLDRDRQRKKEQAIAAAFQGKPAPEPAAPARPLKAMAPRQPSLAGLYFRAHALRVGMSIAAGLLTAMGTFALLHENRYRVPNVNHLATLNGAELHAASVRAQELLDEGAYEAAVKVLEGPIERAMPSNDRSDAQYLQLEAAYLGFRGPAGSDAYTGLLADTDTLVEERSTHPRAPEALRWKARLYEDHGEAVAAFDVYKEIIEGYPNTGFMDEVLMGAARIAIARKDPVKAAAYAQQLIRDFPGSPLTGEARLIRGDAFAVAGLEGDALTRYLQIAETEPDTRLGADAYLRIARLFFEKRDYKNAVLQLEQRLATATTTEGNDEVYLLLAQSYRRAGRLPEARDALNDLLNFLPESKSTPGAYIELSQVMEEMGDRVEALHVAKQAVGRYSDNPMVLVNQGELEGRAGNPIPAAKALLAAEEAGEEDPALVLAAARYLSTAGRRDEALAAYDRLRDYYTGSEQALAGGIEAARIRYRSGDLVKAVEELENLKTATEGRPQRLDALVALSEIYSDLGLNGKVDTLALEISATTEDPELLAAAANTLINSGAIKEGQDLFARVDLARVKNGTAYKLLMNYGTALLAIDPRRGLEMMEEAYANYPDSRTAADQDRLLTAYLQTDQGAAARRLVLDVENHVRDTPVDAPYLVDAANAWGDYLYGKGDFRMAAEAYNSALRAPTGGSSRVIDGLKSTADWAKYQRANALLALDDFRESLTLYDELAASEAPWASDAATKAEYARLNQRLRAGPAAPNQDS